MHRMHAEQLKVCKEINDQLKKELNEAVEVGIMADFYLKTIPLMVDDATLPLNTNPPRTLDILPENVRNRPFFLNLYISLQLGKRW